MAKRPFSVTMRFPLDKYEDFHDWYVNVTRKGFYSFGYPQIDGVFDTDNLVEYQFAKGGSPTYSNPSGDMIEVSMTWEEV